MSLYEVIGGVSFLVILGVIGCKAYNIYRMGNYYSWAGIVGGFVLYFVAWLMLFVCLGAYPEKLVYFVMFQMANWLMLFNVILSLAEIFYQYKNLLPDRSRYMSKSRRY